MKKLLLALAVCGACATAVAQPHHAPQPHRHDQVRPHHKAHKLHKVWVPAHREHGRLVRGHYEMRR